MGVKEKCHMASGVFTIRVRGKRGKMYVQSMGRTARGIKFIKETIEINSKSPTDPNFKQELRNAVDKLMAVQEELPL